LCLISNVSPTVVGAFNAVAGGTFLYIGTTEILGEEFREDLNMKKKERWIKYGVVLFGTAVLSIVRIFTKEDNI